MITKKIRTAEQFTADRMLNCIRIDIDAYEVRNGHRPAKIFLSRPLYHLLRAYNKGALMEWNEEPCSCLYGIRIQTYPVDAYDVLEYYLATGGGMTTLPRED